MHYSLIVKDLSRVYVEVLDNQKLTYCNIACRISSRDILCAHKCLSGTRSPF